MSRNARVRRGMPKNALENTKGTSKHVRKCPGVSGNAQKCPGISRNAGEDSDGAVENCRRMSGKSRGRRGISWGGTTSAKILRECRRTSEKCSGITGHIRTFFDVFRQPLRIFAGIPRHPRTLPYIPGYFPTFFDIPPELLRAFFDVPGRSAKSPNSPGRFLTFFDVPSEISRALFDISGKSCTPPDSSGTKGK